MFSSSQNLITGGTFVDNRVQFHAKGGFERLQEATAPGAFHNSGERFDPPKCHPNTRIAVIKRLMDWILRLDYDTRCALIMWLYGPAGAGKSAIAQTLAELCYAEKKLLASFFFSKNDPRRSTAQALVATLAYQLALVLPLQVREHITSTVEHDPLIFTRSLEAQLTALIVEPILHLAESGYFNDPQAPCLIIIDGLDECDSSRVHCNILDVVFKSFQQRNIPLLYLIASRPETDISSYFDSQSATPMLARLGLDYEYRPDADIRLFLIEKFEEIKQNHRLSKYIPASWPTSDIIDTLVSKSSGQFIYASTVIKFVASARHRPTDRLEIILSARPCAGQTPFAELDALYTHIFSTVEDIESVLTIVGFRIFGSPNTFLWHDNESMEDFLSLNPGDLSLILSDINSLISVREGFHPHILHASLKDFLSDESRSKKLYLNPAERHTQYALIGFKHIRARMTSPAASTDALITSHLFHHCRHSVFTEELRLNIGQLSFESLLTTFSATPSSLVFSTCITDFFSLLESLPWDEDKHLYKEQLNSLDRFFMDNLDTYYSDPFLSLLVAALPHVYLEPLFDMPMACESLDFHRLRLNSGVWFNPEYQELFLNFVQDPGRSEKYFLDGAKYGKAALGALTYLSNHWSYKEPFVLSELEQNIRRNAPRKWKGRYGKNSVLRQIRTQARLNEDFTSYLRCRWDIPPKKFLEWTDPPDTKDSHAYQVFYFALRTLPFVLDRSDKSEELVQFARRTKLGSRTEDFPKESKLARRAIAQYLTRVSEEV